MLFNSIEFLIFFPSVVFLYFLIPFRLRWILLLAASYYFYMCWKPEYIFLIIISTLVDYFAAIMIAHSTKTSRKRIFLAISIITNLGILFTFKYLNFFTASLNSGFILNASLNIPSLNLLLPVGISFYTFQTMGYTIDVYRGRQEPEHNLARFALYVSFFPQLVAGPIERASNLLPQLRGKYSFDYDRVVSGMRLMLWGFFKKVFIADRLAMAVDSVYGKPGDYSGPALIIATIFFAFQIYCDFSGYCDIAIGASRILGIGLMQNFRCPYLADSVPDFWRRWHISLSTWFKDYVYIPLGGSRVSFSRTCVNLFIVFALSGLWHGANWTFVCWGLIHGFFMCMFLFLHKFFPQLENTQNFFIRSGKIALTFIIVCFAWIFFRARSIGDAVYIVMNLFSGFSTAFSSPGSFISMIHNMGISGRDFLLSLLSIALVMAVHSGREFPKIRTDFNNFNIFVRWLVYYSAVITILVYGIYGNKEFIYFQF